MNQIKPNIKELHKIFGVDICINTQDVQTIIKYQHEIKCIAKSESNSYIIEINRLSDVYVNGKSPEYLVEELSAQAGKVFYPLQLKINTFGKFISVHNIEDIQHRWKSIREKLMRYFIGVEVNIYLEKMDQIIASSQKINKSMGLDLFINHFFVSMNLFRVTQRVVSVNSLPTKYLVKWDAEKELTEFGSKKIVCLGTKMRKGYQEGDGIQENNEDYFKANYYLNPQNNLIKEISLNWYTSLFDNKHIIANIYEVEDLWMKEHLQKQETKKGGFFSSLFK